MPANPEDELRTIWQSQFTAAEAMTLEQLRVRAARLAAKARRSIRINQISAALVATVIAVSLCMQKGGLLFNLGKVMLLVVAIYTAWGMNYFFASLPIPAGTPLGSCAALHRRQLERQRDLNLSIRSAVRLNLPGLMLVLVGRFWPSSVAYAGPEVWVLPIAIVASVLFLSEVAITYGQILARRFQREIDELDSMMKETPG